MCPHDHPKTYERILILCGWDVAQEPSDQVLVMSRIMIRIQEFLKQIALSRFIRQVAALVSAEVCAVPALLQGVPEKTHKVLYVINVEPFTIK